MEWSRKDLGSFFQSKYDWDLLAARESGWLAGWLPHLAALLVGSLLLLPIVHCPPILYSLTVESTSSSNTALPADLPKLSPMLQAQLVSSAPLEKLKEAYNSSLSCLPCTSPFPAPALQAPSGRLARTSAAPTSCWTTPCPPRWTRRCWGLSGRAWCRCAGGGQAGRWAGVCGQGVVRGQGESRQWALVAWMEVCRVSICVCPLSCVL